MNVELVKSLLIMTCFFNVLFQFFSMFFKLRALNFSEETKHLFYCVACHQENSYSGSDVKKHKKIARSTQSINGHITTYHSVTCDHCDKVTKQLKKDYINIDKRVKNPLGNAYFRFSGERKTIPYLIKFLIVGLLPLFFLILFLAILN